MTKLNSCHRDIQTILLEAIKVTDFSVLHGHRSPEEQLELWKKGRNERGKIVDKKLVVTHKDGFDKKSRHNQEPSEAVDIAPYPIDWKDEKRFFRLAGVIDAVQYRLLNEGKIQHLLEWGFDLWSWDLPHWQIIRIQRT